MIINITRVTIDVGKIILNYFVVSMAFTLGIYFVLRVNIIHSEPLNEEVEEMSNDNKTEVVSLFGILKTLWWVLLNPGPDTDTFPEEGFAGALTNVLFLVYQGFTIIMLLFFFKSSRSSDFRSLKYNSHFVLDFD